MQTFLPYPSFTESAACLDNKRLGKQRVEVLQILMALHDGKGWVNHPATKMWAANSNALVNYGLVVCREWIRRGYKDTCYNKIRDFYLEAETFDKPWWWGDERLHLSHQSNLKRKDPKHYTFDVPDDLPYWWPC